MDDAQAKLVARKQELLDEFRALSEKTTGLVEQGKELNRALSQLQARQVEIRGAMQEVRSLLGEDPNAPLEAKKVPVEGKQKKK